MLPLEKAKQIQLLILDVDGILTSGMIYYAEEEVEIKGFDIQDGLGIKLLQKVGIPVAIISAKKSEALLRRIKELDIQHFFLDCRNKLIPYEELKIKLRLIDEQIAYMGDDLPDLPILRRAGMAITVPNATDIIKQYAHFVTKNKGGKGAVREICDFIMQAQDRYNSVIQSYLG